MDGTSGDAIAATQAFLAAYSEVRTLLLGDLPGVDGIAGLMHAVRSGRVIEREGTTASGIAYLVHGAGCLMTDRRGRVVDVDLRRDPATGSVVEAADVWRIQQFLASCDAPSVPDEDLEATCQHLSSLGRLRMLDGTGWFAVDHSAHP
ncbi:hypothetical protein ABT369_47275 [Dactylosporangium sp. NPDC000244]|uniref:DUF6896 domain-containing protein n=1 Tax=Dactylosporangium sp. NPDC000244 TaxID=3154365 RepID=UPI003328C312